MRIVGSPTHSPGLDTLRLTNGDSGQQATLYFLPDLHEDISATAVRTALISEEALPPAVAEYIRRHHLYR
jgi:nicotinic acid mononucleotide adenylyltransferase